MRCSSIPKRLAIPKRSAVAMTAALLFAAGCAGSDTSEPAETPAGVDVDDTEIDLADGAFERNDDSVTPSATDSDPGADADGSATDTTTVAATPGTGENDSGGTSTGSDGDGAGSDGDSATDTAATDGSGTDSGESTATTAGSGTDTSTDATGTSGTSGGTSTGDAGSTPVAPAVEPGEGVIVVGGVDYLFPTTLCEVQNGTVLIEGQGISSEFDRFKASIYYVIEDFDNDGAPESTLDVVIDFEVPANAEATDVPELYASKVDSEDFQSGVDIDVVVDGRRISGAGPMFDFNGIVFPVDEPGPMAFDARCT